MCATAILAAPMAPEPLTIRVNDRFVLDAGTCERVDGARGAEILIRPPAITLFAQVLAYLHAQPDPPAERSRPSDVDDGVAAAAAVLRWGSYLAVLLDVDKPTWPEVRSRGTSRIADAEMARIAIEATSALSEWIDLFRADEAVHRRLAARAVEHLPMPVKLTRSQSPRAPLQALADPVVAETLLQETAPPRRERARAAVERHPTRVLANAIVNTAGRNGPVEDLHAGIFRGYPLDRRRMTPAEERRVLDFAGKGLGVGMAVCRRLAEETTGRSWSEQVLPFGLAEMLFVTPTGWSLTEKSREIRLPA
jgi:hypothetical protein